MPDISQQQAQAAELIRSQIERMEDANQTLPYWSLYQAITGGSGGGGGSTDVSLLAKELTLAAVNNKLPNLSNGAVPVIQPSSVVTPQWTVLTTNTTIPAGSVYVYLTVIAGTVTINGLSKTVDDVINLESCLPARHPAITLVIPDGAEVELIRGY